jgi:hypothetical protein
MDLIITSSTAAPLEVLEKYTYHFHYGQSKIHAISGPGHENMPMSLENIKKDMRAVIKRIIELDRVLPRLPGMYLGTLTRRGSDNHRLANRYLLVQVHYTPDAPDDFEAPGFSPACSTRLEVIRDRGWQTVDTAFGGIRTESHSSVSVSQSVDNCL